MHKSLVRLTVIGFLAFMVLSPVSMVAAKNLCPSGVCPDEPGAFVKNGDFAFTILNVVATVMFYGLMLLAVIFVLVAAYMYLTAAGNPEKVEKAQKQLIYAVIAITIAILARSVPFIVTSFVKSNVSGNGGGSSQNPPPNPVDCTTNPEDCFPTGN